MSPQPTRRSLPPAGVAELIDAAREAEREGRHPVARQRYVAALHRLANEDQAALASALVRWIGRTHGAEGDHEAALDCYEAALAIAEASDSAVDAAHAVNWKANVAFARGKLDAATLLYRDALEMAERVGERRLVAMVHQNLGTVANIHGDWAEAMVRYRASLRGYRALGLDEYVGPLLNNIGRLQTDLEEFAEAEDSFRDALSSCAAVGDSSRQILVHVNLTRLCIARRDLARGRGHSDQALNLATQLHEDRWLGEIRKNSGLLYLEADLMALAEESLKLALEHARGREDLLLEAEVNRALAVLFRRQRRNGEVLECLTRAQRVFSGLRARPDIADVDREIARLEAEFLEIVREWGESIESKDHYTQGHCQRVAEYASALAVAVGLDETSLGWFRMGALLHDVGKVSVPAYVLNKEGPLTEDEWVLMKRHPDAGVDLLAGAEFPWDIRPMVRHHHERWDGNGYPAGLTGEAIPLSARILCVADVFDALTTNRSYRAALSPDVALEIMEGDAGHVFDPEIFALFKRHVAATVETRGAAYPRADRLLPPPAASMFSAAQEQRWPPVSAVA
jgi:putative nucleotidyltransferase with HDIG domain